jgi:hypothetical protein
MRAEGRLLVTLVEVAELEHGLPRRAPSVAPGCLCQRHAAAAGAHLAVGEDGVGGIRARPSARPFPAASCRPRRRPPSNCCRPTGRPNRRTSGKLRVTEAHQHLLQRHAHHLGRGLGDDGVAAGADVGHIGLDRHDAALVEPHARRRLRQQVVAEGGCDARCRPASGRRAPGPAAACARTSRSAPRRCGSTRSAAASRTAGADSASPGLLGLRIARRWLGWKVRIDLRVVDDAEFDRVDSQLFRRLVHRDFQRHQARRLARRAHGVAFRQVEHAQGGARSGGWRRHRAPGLLHRGSPVCHRAGRPTSFHARWR